VSEPFEFPTEEFGSLEAAAAFPGPSSIKFVEAGWTFDYFLHPKGNETLVVMLPSALMAANRRVPHFYRWSWSALMPEFDVLCVSDPMLYLGDEVLAGWMTGRADDNLVERIDDHLAKLQTILGYKNIIFAGSSLGGYVGLLLAASAKDRGLDLGRGGVYAENPQIDLLQFGKLGPQNLIAQLVYGVETAAEIPSQYLERWNAADYIANRNLDFNGTVLIKESDVHHYQVHIPILRKMLADKKSNRIEIEVIPKEVDNTGHTALTLREMKPRLLRLLQR
jgi:pimeloyl-ACP methyl ester carboxylesterase